MKTVAKIDPEKEYELAKKLIELASRQSLNSSDASALSASVDNIVTAVRVLMERESLRRGHPKPSKDLKPKGRQKGESREEIKKLPSLKYPNLEVEEFISRPEVPPTCPCCEQQMKESGLFDCSEKLEVVPKKYFIKRIKRVKFNCSKCYGAIVTSPPVASIVPSSNYGDSLIIDVALSKFLDLIPMERICLIAYQSGLGAELPAQSMIGVTHHLANLFICIYTKLKIEVFSSEVIHCDESPHKMLEGDDTNNWYLWGQFCKTACYFEAHNTRSGNVIYELLKQSSVKTIVTDGYTGYKRALDILKNDNIHIDNALCNSHAYRYFEDASLTWKSECEFFLKTYGEIYEIEKQRVNLDLALDHPMQAEYRLKLRPLFEGLKLESEKIKQNTMPQSKLEQAINYFLNHFEGLTLCIYNPKIPLDNNYAERQIRPHVVGRKTWYGTHSKRGAMTAQVMFSIILSCKVNNVNPRDYFPWVVERILNNKDVYTPHQYSQLILKTNL